MYKPKVNITVNQGNYVAPGASIKIGRVSVGGFSADADVSLNIGGAQQPEVSTFINPVSGETLVGISIPPQIIRSSARSTQQTTPDSWELIEHFQTQGISISQKGQLYKILLNVVKLGADYEKISPSLEAQAHNLKAEEEITRTIKNNNIYCLVLFKDKANLLVKELCTVLKFSSNHFPLDTPEKHTTPQVSEKALPHTTSPTAENNQPYVFTTSDEKGITVSVMSGMTIGAGQRVVVGDINYSGDERLISKPSSAGLFKPRTAPKTLPQKKLLKEAKECIERIETAILVNGFQDYWDSEEGKEKWLQSFNEKKIIIDGFDQSSSRLSQTQQQTLEELVLGLRSDAECITINSASLS